MNQDRIVAGVVIAVTAVSGIGWVVVPSFQDAQRTVDAEASLHLERARRLFHQYHADLGYQALLVGELGEFDVAVEDPDDLTEYAAEVYEETHAYMWETFQPTDWGDPPRPAQASYGDVSDQIRKGIRTREELVRGNQRVLASARAAVDEAMSISSGDVSARSHAEANRLKGAILHHMGLGERLKATLKRAEAEPYRNELVSLGIGAAALEPVRTLVGASGVDRQIGLLNERATQAESTLAQDREALADLDATIEGMQSRLAEAESRKVEAREAMQRLNAAGVDFSDPDGVRNFRERLAELDHTYRDAAREGQMLQVGSFPNARIDASEDFLNGKYLEDGSPHNLTVHHGLNHYGAERRVLAAKIQIAEATIDALHAEARRLAGLRGTYQDTQQEAAAAVAEAQSQASDAFAELNRVESEASAIEEEALDLLRQSARILKQAGNLAGQWVSDARERTEGLSSEAVAASAMGMRTRDSWMGGHISAQAADAYLAMAWIYYDRFRTALQTADALAGMPDSARPAEADVEAERTKAEEARDAGVQQITEAMNTLQRAHGDAEGHWTLVAQAAGTTYLLTLFGDDSYVDDVIEGYRKALQNREDKAYTGRLVARLRRLEQARE